MFPSNGLSLLPSGSQRSGGSLTVTIGSGSGNRSTLYLQGALRVPLARELRRTVYRLLRRGERLILLDLADVLRIDAAGVGELVRTYNMAVAAQGVMQVVHCTAWVSQLLQRAGLFEILTEGALSRELRSSIRARQPVTTSTEEMSSPGHVHSTPQCSCNTAFH